MECMDDDDAHGNQACTGLLGCTSASASVLSVYRSGGRKTRVSERSELRVRSERSVAKLRGAAKAAGLADDDLGTAHAYMLGQYILNAAQNFLLGSLQHYSGTVLPLWKTSSVVQG